MYDDVVDDLVSAIRNDGRVHLEAEERLLRGMAVEAINAREFTRDVSPATPARRSKADRSLREAIQRWQAYQAERSARIEAARIAALDAKARRRKPRAEPSDDDKK